MSAVFAVDIGGTKFAGAVVRADRTIADRAEVPVGADPTATLAALVARFDLTGVTGVGVGSAGPVHLDLGAVSPVNIPAWRRFPITAVLADLTGGRPVALAGDAQCMALGEHWHADIPTLLGVVVSTGVGGGLVLDGAPYLGRTGNAGHIGHIAVGRDDEPCPCGAFGCVERLASGPGMVRWAAGLGWTGTDARALAADAARGVPVARQAFARGADALAAAIVNTATLFDLHTAVVGGGVAAAGPVLFDPLRAAVARRSGIGFLHDLTVLPTALGRDAGLYGAAALALARA
ncbi:ROK family protein [Dactylosporangium siamense]|uniref:Sugar kinase n=1 Tax=Dactylosporangium siamense TaxID=685454 RepID=A0A919U5R6_9ACTN|nr:ROK family protein [Dactylosporangium siamense]GIG42642.1 sugar kinase [Dactylosporangium siamense]